MRRKVGIVVGIALASLAALPVVAQEVGNQIGGRGLMNVSHRLLPSSAELWEQNLGKDTVVYDVSGSTNTPPYRIMLKRNGEVSYECAHNRARNLEPFNKQGKASPEATAKIFADLEKSWPFKAEPHGVAKSASFGTCSYISYDGAHTPDLDTIRYDPDVQSIASELVNLKTVFDHN